MRRFYIQSSAIILIFLASGKAISILNGPEKLLPLDDPIFKIPYSTLLLIAAIVEAAIACVLLYKKFSERLKVTFLFLFSILLLGYRLLLWVVAWDAPCGCLGGIADGLRLSVQQADILVKLILVYFLGGAYFLIMSRKISAINAKNLTGSDALNSQS